MSTDGKQDKEVKQDLDKTDKMIKSFADAIGDYAASVKKAAEKSAKLQQISKQKIVTYEDVLARGKAVKSMTWSDVKVGAYRVKASTIEKAIQATLQAKKLAVFFKAKGYSQAERERQKKEFKTLQARYDQLIKENDQIKKEIEAFGYQLTKQTEDTMKKTQAELKKTPKGGETSTGWSWQEYQQAENFVKDVYALGKFIAGAFK